MSLRAKLLLALSPLLLALGIAVIAGGIMSATLGKSSRRIFDDNYRSVLAAQRMKEAIERIDSGALFVVLDESEKGAAQVALSRRRFEDELRVEEKNITEAGETEAAARLRKLWTDYQEKYVRFGAVFAPERKAYYFTNLLPAFVAVKDAADVILDMNQDAMIHKSAKAERSSQDWSRVVFIVGLTGCVLALIASSTWMTRLLRPLSILETAARRIGEGDLSARAIVEGTGEVAALAKEFNTMASRLQKYHDSSLGELLQAQQDLQAAIDSLPDPVLVIASGGDLLHVNRAAEALLGVRLSEATDWLGAVDPELRAVLERVRTHVLSGKGPYVPKGLDEATRVAAPEGERYLLPRASPVYDEERTVIGTTIVLQDVTRLLRFDELKNNLVATVAHEFRTPLTSIRMAIHLCSEGSVGPLTDKQADLLFAAREDCDRLQTIVDELLDVSRLQEGRPLLERSPVSAEGLVREAVDAHGSEAGGAKVQLRPEVLPGVGNVMADPDRIQIVLSNLITNAIHHSPPGTTVAARAERSDGWVRFEVSDQGPGIAPEHKRAIFERFYQAPGGKPGRAGLGLSIAKDIVDEHGGSIGVDSEPGKGARFWFRLPAAEEVAS
jgi:NtrC-family two-component system sensor histidine kinase KinB